MAVRIKNLASFALPALLIALIPFMAQVSSAGEYKTFPPDPETTKWNQYYGQIFHNFDSPNERNRLADWLCDRTFIQDNLAGLVDCKSEKKRLKSPIYDQDTTGKLKPRAEVDERALTRQNLHLLY